MKTLHIALALTLACTGLARAGDLSKEQCVDAHSRGQDARESGKLSLARKLFLTCAQSSCPGAVQGDCARFADDLSNLQPTIVLVARDGNGNDLPNTTVYIDGALIMTRIDGKPIDIDPGNHTIKFSSGGKDEVVTIVIGSGEKGRSVAARFGSPSGETSPARSVTREPAIDPVAAPARAPRPRTSHPGAAMPLAITGGGLALAGTALAFYGASRVPSNCALSTNECAAPPGDPSFDKAASGARIMNYGLVAGSLGVATLAGGLIWYFAGAKTRTESPTQVSPVVTRDSAGFAFTGSF